MSNWSKKPSELLVIFSFTLIFLGGAFSQVSAQEPPSATVKRANPAPAQKVIRQGNQLRAAPGYRLKKGRGNQVLVLGTKGDTGGDVIECGCSAAGECVSSTSGDTAICSKSSNTPCHGTCSWGDPVIVTPEPASPTD